MMVSARRWSASTTFVAWRRVVQLAATGVMCVATLAGCPRGDVTTTGPEVFTAIQGALNKRLEAVHDVSVEGSITDPAGTTLGFRYAMQQPTFSVGELLDPDGNRLRAFAFDGKYLAVVDDGTKTVLRQDLTLNEEQMLLTLHQVFSPFVCEGWRPPLLKAKGTTASRTGDVVTLTVPVGEGGVKEQVVRLKADGSFIGKSTVAVDGTVLTSTEVLTSGIDRGTGLSFPISWAMVEGGSRGTIFLTATAINQGVPAARFATTVPAGYTERTP
jgi:hypothetical protein